MVSSSDTVGKRKWYQQNTQLNLDNATPNTETESAAAAAAIAHEISAATTPVTSSVARTISDAVNENNAYFVDCDDERDCSMMPRLYLVQQSHSQSIQDRNNLNKDTDRANTSHSSNTNIKNKSDSEEHEIPEWLELPATGITEISGEAGTGKTQLGLGLCVSCASRSFSAPLSDTPTHYTTQLESIDNDYYYNKQKQTQKSKQRKRDSDNAYALMKTNKHHVHNPYDRSIIQPKLTHTNHDSSIHLPQRQQSINHTPTTPKYMHYKSMYISMGAEGTSPSQIAHRLQQMAQRHPSHPSSTTHKASSNNIKAILQRIWTRYVPNTEAFHQLIFSELPQLLFHQKNTPHTPGTLHCGDRFGLLVFDSIAGLYRTKEEGNDNDNCDLPGRAKQSTSMYYAQRSQDLFTIAAQLKYISDHFGVGIVVLNQVTATNSTTIHKRRYGRGIGAGAYAGGGRLMIVPALGLTWSNCVNHRYILSRVEEQIDRGAREEQQHEDISNRVTRFVRKIRVYCSPRFSTAMEASFRIGGCGVFLVHNQGTQ